MKFEVALLLIVDAYSQSVNHVLKLLNIKCHLNVRNKMILFTFFVLYFLILK